MVMCLRLAVTLVALAALAAPAVAADTHTLFLRQDPDGQGGCAGRLYLSPVAGVGEPNCGTFGTADQAESYGSGPGLAVRLDAAADATGRLVFRPYLTAGPAGVGLASFEATVTLTGTTRTGRFVSLGSDRATFQATPADAVVTWNFTVDLPATVDGAELASVTLDYRLSGTRVLHWFNEKNGASFLRLPRASP